MLYAGLDLGGQGSYLWVMTGKGEKMISGRVATTKAALAKAFEPWVGQGIKVAVEAGGSTRWVHDYLLTLGVAEVYVVNPHRMKLIAQSRKKTDKVDAKLLAQLYRLDGLPERVHMPSPQAAEARMLNQGRSSLVKQRTKLNNTVRGFLRGLGIRLPARYLNSPKNWDAILAEPELDRTSRLIIESYKPVVEELGKAIKKLEKETVSRNQVDPRIGLLQTIPGVGPQSSSIMVAAVDDINRFKGAKRLASYAGLVPTVRNSGQRQATGHINRQGRKEIRRVFVQAAHRVITLKTIDARPLQEWFFQVLNRRGYRTAVVALARRLVTICYAVLKTMVPYNPDRLRLKA